MRKKTARFRRLYRQGISSYTRWVNYVISLYLKMLRAICRTRAVSEHSDSSPGSRSSCRPASSADSMGNRGGRRREVGFSMFLGLNGGDYFPGVNSTRRRGTLRPDLSGAGAAGMRAWDSMRTPRASGSGTDGPESQHCGLARCHISATHIVSISYSTASCTLEELAGLETGKRGADTPRGRVGHGRPSPADAAPHEGVPHGVK